jgi:hypothetical protein
VHPTATQYVPASKKIPGQPYPSNRLLRARPPIRRSCLESIRSQLGVFFSAVTLCMNEIGAMFGRYGEDQAYSRPILAWTAMFRRTLFQHPTFTFNHLVTPLRTWPDSSLTLLRLSLPPYAPIIIQTSASSSPEVKLGADSLFKQTLMLIRLIRCSKINVGHWHWPQQLWRMQILQCSGSTSVSFHLCRVRDDLWR